MNVRTHLITTEDISCKKHYNLIVSNKKVRKFELVLFLLYPIIATLLSIYLNVNVLIGVILFLGLPALYLSFRVPINTVVRSLLFSSLLIPLIWIINWLAHKNQQWIIPYTKVPFYIDGIPMFEVSLWVVFLTHFTILFYEYFLDRHFIKKIWYPRMKLFLKLLIFVPVLILLINHFFPLSYFYMIFGTLGVVIPILLVEFKLPKLIAKLIKVGIYFFYVTFLYEIVALKLNHWYFPTEGKFIGWVTFYGEWFPVEEFVFWLILCAMATLSVFEFFDDDAK